MAASRASLILGWVILGSGSGLTMGCDRAAAKSADPAISSAAAAPKRAPSAAPRCPPEMADLGAYCVDRWEAQLVEVGSGSDHPPTLRLKFDTEYRAVSRPHVKPQGYISRVDAERSCRNAGKRLCRAREWLRACEGVGRRFDWRGKCNLDKGHVMTALFGTRITLTYDAHYNSPRLNEEPGFLAETGEYTGCVNEHGLHDMVGNLHEWVADDVSVRLKREIPIPYDDSVLGARGNGVFMGGYFSSHGEHGKGCNYVTTNHRPEYHDYSTGFRCCADPQL